MKVGDYVRTKSGIIGKIKSIDNQTELEDLYLIKRKWYYEEDIIKSSPNLIDLIKVGDYVNGSYAEGFIEKNKFQNKLIITEAGMIDNNDIKSIVTKECFESMEYKVKE